MKYEKIYNKKEKEEFWGGLLFKYFIECEMMSTP